MVQTISPAELADLLATDDVDLIDVRDHAEFETGSIAGARLVPLDTLRADPDLVLARDGRPLIFVCAKGVRSLAAAKLADRFGYPRLFSLDGGTKEWARVGYPLLTSQRVAA